MSEAAQCPAPDRLTNREIQLARLHVAEYNVARVFKGKRAIFELTHRLEAAS
jgi:hypothetical protein